MKKIILFTIYLIPVLLLIGFVANFSVNVPIDDEWRLASLFEKIATGNATFNDFWALHSNHRIVFPKIIIAVLAFVSRWNINYPLCFSIGLAAVTFIAFYKLSSMQVNHVGDNLWHLANILTCILIFSLVQHENWLWGFQLAWFLVNFCFVAAVYVLVCDRNLLIYSASLFLKICRGGAPVPALVLTGQPRGDCSYDNYTDDLRSLYLRISIAALFCFIASFSLAQGLLSWLAAIPAVATLAGKTTQKRKGLILWMLLFVATCAIYSIDYHPSRKTSIISLLHKPLVVIDYFLSLLGSPIVRLPGISALVGLLILAIFLFLAFHFGKKINQHLEAVPWLSIGLFALLSALIITLGRAEFGAIQAIESSRYTTNSILLLIALVQLGQLFVIDKSAIFYCNYKLVARLLSGVSIGIIIVNYGQAIAQSRSALAYKQGGQDCLALINYLEPSDFFNSSPESCLRILSKKTWLVREGAAIIDRINWRKLAKNVEFIDNPGEVYGYFDKPQIGDGSLTIKKNAAVSAAGWAIIPDAIEQPNIVLLSYGDQKTFFANAYVNLDSSDIAKALKSQLYSNARWTIAFLANNLPIGQTEIKAWVYNPVDNQFVKLRGDAKVTVEEE